MVLGDCIAGAFFDRCSLNTVTAPSLRGELVLRDCHFRPDVQEVQGDFYTLDSTLGTRLANCTIHAPAVSRAAQPEMVNRSGLVEINGTVRYYQLNTALGNRIVAYCRDQGIELDPDFIARLRAHHDMED